MRRCSSFFSADEARISFATGDKPSSSSAFFSADEARISFATGDKPSSSSALEVRIWDQGNGICNGCWGGVGLGVVKWGRVEWSGVRLSGIEWGRVEWSGDCLVE
jgi:hypothetical protein